MATVDLAAGGVNGFRRLLVGGAAAVTLLAGIGYQAETLTTRTQRPVVAAQVTPNIWHWESWGRQPTAAPGHLFTCEQLPDTPDGCAGQYPGQTDGTY